jgi:hypothetical protein
MNVVQTQHAVRPEQENLDYDCRENLFLMRRFFIPLLGIIIYCAIPMADSVNEVPTSDRLSYKFLFMTESDM